MERLAAIEATLNGKGGILDRLLHLDHCVDELKRTVWKATGAAVALASIVQFLLKHS